MIARLIVLTIVSLVAIGCVSTSTVDSGVAPHKPKADQALIVLYRPGMFSGSVQGIKISFNDEVIGAMANDSLMYFYTDRSGGILLSLNPPASVMGGARAEIELIPGETYFFEMVLGSGESVALATSGAGITNYTEVRGIGWRSIDPDTGWALFESKRRSKTYSQKNRTQKE